jgi:hypothetical protein
MATAKQIAANRRNAQKSRGPVTEEGKKITSQNARRHGLCAPFQVLPNVENQEDFDALLEAFIDAEKPTDALEHELVVTMAEQFWLAKRATRMQNTRFIAKEPTPKERQENQFPIRVEHEAIQLFLRYHTAHYRAYRHAMHDLQSRRKQKQLQEIGSVRQKHAAAEELRRETTQTQRDERHAATMRLQKTKQQIAECRLMKISHDTAKLFDGLFPPEMATVAA